MSCKKSGEKAYDLKISKQSNIELKDNIKSEIENIISLRYEINSYLDNTQLSSIDARVGIRILMTINYYELAYEELECFLDNGIDKAYDNFSVFLHFKEYGKTTLGWLKDNVLHEK